jgi:hypothetical protein
MNNYPEESYGAEDGPHGCWIIDSYDEGPVFIVRDDDPRGNDLLIIYYVLPDARRPWVE